jgi:LacI family transcriptional regulator
MVRNNGERPPLNLQQLSSALGLSKTTVSRALAGYADVSPATRERVREAAERCGYRPSATARRLALGRVEAVGMILPTGPGHFDDPFFIELITSLAERLAAADLDLLVTTAAPGAAEMRALKRFVEHKRVDAMILARTQVRDERITYLLDRRFPFVSHGRSADPRGHASLDTDGAAAMATAVDHLVALGHARIGFIGAPDDRFFAVDRFRGFMAGLDAHGLSPVDSAVRHGAIDEASAAPLARSILAAEPRPTALLCATDRIAVGAMRAARDLGFAVPADLSVIGFDDLPAGRHSDPALTTMGQSVGKAGHHLADMLLALLAGTPAEELREIWPVELIVRGSDGPPPVDGVHQRQEKAHGKRPLRARIGPRAAEDPHRCIGRTA